MAETNRKPTWREFWGTVFARRRTGTPRRRDWIEPPLAVVFGIVFALVTGYWFAVVFGLSFGGIGLARVVLQHLDARDSQSPAGSR